MQLARRTMPQIESLSTRLDDWEILLLAHFACRGQ
jgi:hypothetical protein